eukprot:98479-Alexandrium_andersonii.AAC.1
MLVLAILTFAQWPVDCVTVGRGGVCKHLRASVVALLAGVVHSFQMPCRGAARACVDTLAPSYRSKHACS